MIYKFASVESQNRLAALMRQAYPADRAAADVMFHKATGYGWGRTDAPGYVWPAHKGDALDFGMNYAIHVLTPGSMHALREAFELWYAGIGLDKEES